MTTVRRLYFYGLTLISLEVVIWGVVGLLRTLYANGLRGQIDLLATGISLVVVGTPIFWLHWRIAQRDAAQDPVERSSRVRAIFLYGTLFVLVGSILFAFLALINRGLVGLLGQPTFLAWYGADQTAADQLIAAAVNAAALVYFWRVLRLDWQADLPESFLPEARRLYRYVWMLVGLTLTIAGVYNLIRYFLTGPDRDPRDIVPILAGAAASLIVGVPLWGWSWWTVQESLRDPAERNSLLRLVVLYLISLAGVVGVVASAGSVLSSLISWLIGEPGTFQEFLYDNAEGLSAVVPFSIMWAYYGGILNREVARMPDQPRRNALHWLYYYILSLLGLALSFTGLVNILDTAATLLINPESLSSEILTDQVGNAAAALLVGLPLWLITWRDVQSAALRKDDLGDRARRSIVRRTYLYLVIFLLVVGVMSFSGVFLFTLLSAVLSQDIPGDFVESLARLLLWLALDAALLVYHFRVLQRDNLLAQRSLGDLHAGFPTLILDETSTLLTEYLLQEVQRAAPRLPIALHQVQQGAPDEAMLGAKAVLMPMGLALEPPESLRLWLAEYQGQRLLIPIQKQNYIWLGQVEKSPQEMARETARSLRQMAEGETLRNSLPSNPWMVTGTILAGLFGLLLILFLFSLMFSIIFQ